MEWEQLAGKQITIKQESLPLDFSKPEFESQVCIERYCKGWYALFVPSDIENRERLIDGLFTLDWILIDDDLFLFPKSKLQKMIHLTSNYSVRWGIVKNER